jgi:hypothetical protein
MSGEMVKRIQAAIGVAAGLLGLAAYVYLLGGLVMWLRFTAARVPADDAVRALDRNHLLAVGLKAFVFELILVGAVTGLTLLVWLHVRNEDDDRPKEKEEWVAWIFVMQALVAGLLVSAVVSCYASLSLPLSILAGVFVAVVWMAFGPRVLNGLDGDPAKLAAMKKKARKKERKRRKRNKKVVKTLLTLIAVGLAIVTLSAPAGIVILVALLFLHLSHLLDVLPTTEDLAKLIPAVLVLGAGLSLIVGAYLATPPVSLDYTHVVLRDGETVRGGYVGENSEGVFLATCLPEFTTPKVSRASHVKIVPADEVKRVIVGSSNYVVDYGKNPSLLDLAIHMQERGEIEQPRPTASIDLREDRLVCGLNHFIRMIHKRRDGGAVTQRVKVRAAGELTLHGAMVHPVSEDFKAARKFSLPLELNLAGFQANPCKRWVRTAIKVKFVPEDGDPETVRLKVVLPRPLASGGIEACRL